MNLVMTLVAVFTLAGEPRTVRLSTPTLQQCVSELQVVEVIARTLGAQDVRVHCELKVE